jgi:hypothetical protein
VSPELPRAHYVYPAYAKSEDLTPPPVKRSNRLHRAKSYPASAQNPIVDPSPPTHAEDADHRAKSGRPAVVYFSCASALLTSRMNLCPSELTTNLL